MARTTATAVSLSGSSRWPILLRIAGLRGNVALIGRCRDFSSHDLRSSRSSLKAAAHGVLVAARVPTPCHDDPSSGSFTIPASGPCGYANAVRTSVGRALQTGGARCRRAAASARGTGKTFLAGARREAKLRSSTSRFPLRSCDGVDRAIIISLFRKGGIARKKPQLVHRACICHGRLDAIACLAAGAGRGQTRAEWADGNVGCTGMGLKPRSTNGLAVSTLRIA